MITYSLWRFNYYNSIKTEKPVPNEIKQELNPINTKYVNLPVVD